MQKTLRKIENALNEVCRIAFEIEASGNLPADEFRNHQRSININSIANQAKNELALLSNRVKNDNSGAAIITTGNYAKMREALLEVVRRLEPIVKYMHPNKEEHIGLTTVFAACEPIYKIANAALSAPARNCDVISNRDDAVRLFQAAFVEAAARHLHLTNAAYVKIIEPLGELLEIAIEVLYSTYHAEDSAAQNTESEVSHGNA